MVEYDNYLDLEVWQESNFAKPHIGHELYFDAQLRGHGIRIDGSHVLEIGFGNGEFLGFARN